MSLDRTFTTASNAVARAAGAPTTFLVCCVVVIVWAVSGPFFGFSDTWQLVINTDTTIVTFLMVFLIQNTRNRDPRAIQAKLDEIIRASASQNTFIGIEHLTQVEVEEFRVKCAARAAAATARNKAVLRADKAAKDAVDRAYSGSLDSPTRPYLALRRMPRDKQRAISSCPRPCANPKSML